MPRVQDNKEATTATAAKPQNPFAALAESDSEEEIVAPVEPVVKKDEVFPPQSPPLRTWPTPERNAFSSPFSKKRWAKPRFKEDNDGWVSIRWNQPQFQDETPRKSPPLAPLGVKYQPRTPPFYPMADPDAETKVLEDDSPIYASVTPPNLDLGPIAPIVLENTITPSQPQEQLTALAWAEKVKQSLEKAEAARAAKGRPTDTKTDEDFKEALGRLSFFRRGIQPSASE